MTRRPTSRPASTSHSSRDVNAPQPKKSAAFPLSIEQVSPTGLTPRAVTPAGSRPEKKILRPQTPLSHAHEHAARHATPSGLGLDSHLVRRRMVEKLCRMGLEDHRIIQAMLAVPRHRFVDSALVNQAYEDTSLPIGWAQTISKPSVVARMIELLCQRPVIQCEVARPLGRVLEIGSGCGYQAAVLACLAKQVLSIERLKALHERARANLAEVRGEMALRLDVRLIFGDGHIGHAPNAPYDCIIAAAGAPHLPSAWLEQLAPGGRLVAPLEHAGSGAQALIVVDRLLDGSLVHSRYEAVQFVPLKSGTT